MTQTLLRSPAYRGERGMTMYTDEDFRGNVTCPDCGALIPQYIRHYAGTWDTREECPMCGYSRDYDLENPHGA